MISYRKADLLETVKYRGNEDATVQYAFVFEKTWQNEDGTGILKKGPNGGLEAWCSVEIGNISDKRSGFVSSELHSRVASKLRPIAEQDPLRHGPKVQASPDMGFDDCKKYIADYYKPKFQALSPTPVTEKFTDVGGSFWMFFNFTVKIL